MAKSAEEIREELLARRKGERQERMATANENGHCSTQKPRQRLPMQSPARQAGSRLCLPPGLTELPHSIEAEQALLSSMMMDRSVVPEIARKLSADYFYVPAHRMIFQAILDHFERVEVMNFSTVTQHLIEVGQINSVGGPAYITEVGTMIPTSANIAYYLDIVETKCALRRLITDATETVRRAYEPQADVQALVEYVQHRAEWLATLSLPRKTGLTVRTVSELMGMTFDETDNYFGDRILAAGQACTLLGPGGVGKSRLSLQLAVCMITGRDFIDMPTRAKGMKWLFVQTENSNRRLHHDLKNIVRALELTGDALELVEHCLFIHTLENDTDCFLNLLNPENYGAVNRMIQDVKPDFVQWDPLNSMTDNDLNSDMDMRAVVSAIAIATRAGNANRVPFVVHHSLTGKIGAARAVGWDKASYGRNSKVLHAWTRAQINLALRSADDPDLLIMSCGKNNNGRLFSEVG
jgi:hypothetical protein